MPQKRMLYKGPGISRESHGIAPMLLHLNTAAQGIAIRSRGEDAGNAGLLGEPAAIVPRVIHSYGGREAFHGRWNGGCIQPRKR